MELRPRTISKVGRTLFGWWNLPLVVSLCCLTPDAIAVPARALGLGCRGSAPVRCVCLYPERHPACTLRPRTETQEDEGRRAAAGQGNGRGTGGRRGIGGKPGISAVGTRAGRLGRARAGSLAETRSLPPQAAWGRSLGDWLGGSTLVKGDGVVFLGVRSDTISKPGREQTDGGTSPSCVGASHGRHVVQLLCLPWGITLRQVPGRRIPPGRRPGTCLLPLRLFFSRAPIYADEMMAERWRRTAIRVPRSGRRACPADADPHRLEGIP